MSGGVVSSSSAHSSASSPPWSVQPNHTLFPMEERGCGAYASQLFSFIRVVSLFQHNTRNTTYSVHHIILYAYTYISAQHAAVTHLCRFVQGRYGVSYSAYRGRLDTTITGFHRLQHSREPGVFILFSIYRYSIFVSAHQYQPICISAQLTIHLEPIMCTTYRCSGLWISRPRWSSACPDIWSIVQRISYFRWLHLHHSDIAINSNIQHDSGLELSFMISSASSTMVDINNSTSGAIQQCRHHDSTHQLYAFTV